MTMHRISVAALSTMSILAKGSRGNLFVLRKAQRSMNMMNISRNRAFSKTLHLRGGATEESSETKWTKLADPAPGSPFHLALPVHNLEVAKEFYGNVLGCAEGRSSEKWQDYSLNGHQIVCHWAGDDYRCIDYFNPVDGDDIPVPHFGLALTEDEFKALVERLQKAGVKFIIEPTLRFKGMPGEQWTMFFKDPSGNNLEFKAMTTIDNLFAKYNVE